MARTPIKKRSSPIHANDLDDDPKNDTPIKYGMMWGGPGVPVSGKETAAILGGAAAAAGGIRSVYGAVKKHGVVGAAKEAVKSVDRASRKGADWLLDHTGLRNLGVESYPDYEKSLSKKKKTK